MCFCAVMFGRVRGKKATVGKIVNLRPVLVDVRCKLLNKPFTLHFGLYYSTEVHATLHCCPTYVFSIAVKCVSKNNVWHHSGLCHSKNHLGLFRFKLPQSTAVLQQWHRTIIPSYRHLCSAKQTV